MTLTGKERRVFFKALREGWCGGTSSDPFNAFTPLTAFDDRTYDDIALELFIELHNSTRSGQSL
tara:strand:- start:110 stop:301 length:192 start_codon:yes stop_codon:yes gene_type:complete